MKQTIITKVDLEIGRLIGQQFMYGSSLRTVEKIFITEKGKTFIVSTEGDIVQREYADFITAIYTK